jgi:hypothetical protein
MVPDLDRVVALCGSAGTLPASGGIVLALLLAGLAGSAVHCVPMCGGFVLGQVADRMARLPAARLCEWQRIGAGALLPYHAGRLTTYALLGMAAGGGGGLLMRLPWFGLVSAALLLLAAGLFLLQALRRLAPIRLAFRWLPRGWPAALALLPAAPRGLSRAIAHLATRLDASRRSGSFVLGLLLGLLPCGLLYAALAASGASASALAGGLAMVAFGLGTVPALVTVGIAGQAAGHRFRRGVAALSPMVMLLNAALLVALALRPLMIATS